MERAEPDLGSWIGKQTAEDDVVGAGMVRRMIAALPGVSAPGPMSAPLLAHWLLFQPDAATETLGPDGHPPRGTFLPPVARPRRMWAGGRVSFHAPLRIGQVVTRRSTIAAISERKGESGALTFVDVDHLVSDGEGVVLTERQNLVYRDAPVPGQAAPAPRAAPTDPQWSDRIDPGPVLLFRYSALTFNSHRIHYDRPYAIEGEGYAGLVVHGPLIATLLLHAFIGHHPGADVAQFDFRLVRPLIDTAPFYVCGSIEGATANLFARDDQGALAATATVTLRGA